MVHSLRRSSAALGGLPILAFMAGLTETLWNLEDLYNAVMKQQAEKKQALRIEGLLKKLRSL
jgi:hypothetical protein